MRNISVWELLFIRAQFSIFGKGKEVGIDKKSCLGANLDLFHLDIWEFQFTLENKECKPVEDGFEK